MLIETPTYFDYLAHARAAGLEDDQIDALVRRWRVDYGRDQHLLELRLLRTCKAIERGSITYEEAMASEVEA